MAKAKQSVLPKDYKAYFFLATDAKDGVHVVYEDGNDQAIFAAAFASAMAEDDDLFGTISTAILALLESKDPDKKPKKKAAPKKTVKKKAK